MSEPCDWTRLEVYLLDAPDGRRARVTRCLDCGERDLEWLPPQSQQEHPDQLHRMTARSRRDQAHHKPIPTPAFAPIH